MEKAITIIVRPYDEGGYYYDVYDHEHNSLNCAEVEECDSEDGGWCTTTLENALDMAHDAAKRVEFRTRAGLIECPVCNETISGPVADSAHGHGYVHSECREREDEEGDIIENR